jgi:hypothetical protein
MKISKQTSIELAFSLYTPIGGTDLDPQSRRSASERVTSLIRRRGLKFLEKELKA